MTVLCKKVKVFGKIGFNLKCCREGACHIAMLLLETTSCPFLGQLSRVGPIVINQKTRGKTAFRRGFPRGSTLGHSNILDSALLCSLDKN